MLRYFTAGETHGKCLTVIIEGMPSGVEISLDEINEQLAKRQHGYGRGGRMKIEKDTAEILSGVRGGGDSRKSYRNKIENRDWANWESIMGTEAANNENIYRAQDLDTQSLTRRYEVQSQRFEKRA